MIAESAGLGPDMVQIERLAAYRDWLEDEAVSAGGLGPMEKSRLNDRHIGDSLLFLQFLPSMGPVLDVGSGVGLPGIPLAVLRPDMHFILLDRSEKRCDLLRRALRVVGVLNAEVVQTDVTRWRQPVPAVVSRATIPPETFLPILHRVLEPGGVGILGGSWDSRPSVAGYETKEIAAKALAQPVWLLNMRKT